MYIKVVFFLLLIISLLGCKNEKNIVMKDEIIVYCGITMVDPIMKIGKIFEKENNVKFTISYGGSTDLLNSIELSKKGDIFFPGTETYIKEAENKNLILEKKVIGYNKLVFFVKKGNPYNFNNKVEQLLDKNIKFAIGNPDLGSVGRETKKVLDKKNIYEKVVSNAAIMEPDSKGLTTSLIDGKVDLVLNWRSVKKNKDNENYIEDIIIENNLADDNVLSISSLIYTKNKKITQKFLDLCESERGQKIFREYGF